MNEILHTRLTSLWPKILGFSSVTGRDLRRMYAGATMLWTEMSKEHVECRRLGKNTPKFNDLTAKLETSIDTLEQYLVVATLLNG